MTTRTLAAAGVPLGDASTELTRGVESYLDTLRRIHAALRPRLYLEIGVRHGWSLRLARCRSVGVDPEFVLSSPAGAITTLYQESSDAFFNQHAAHELKDGLDLAFIDGMHHFEVALRDFIGVERHAALGAVALIDDVFPNSPAQATRDRSTRVWCGDVWKLHACLACYRPDLLLVPLDCSPAGLLVVIGLNPANQTLASLYDRLLKWGGETTSPPPDVYQRTGAWRPTDPRLPALWRAVVELRNGALDVVGVRRRWSQLTDDGSPV